MYMCVVLTTPTPTLLSDQTLPVPPTLHISPTPPSANVPPPASVHPVTRKGPSPAARRDLRPASSSFSSLSSSSPSPYAIVREHQHDLWLLQNDFRHHVWKTPVRTMIRANSPPDSIHAQVHAVHPRNTFGAALHESSSVQIDSNLDTASLDPSGPILFVHSCHPEDLWPS